MSGIVAASGQNNMNPAGNFILSIFLSFVLPLAFIILISCFVKTPRRRAVTFFILPFACFVFSMLRPFLHKILYAIFKLSFFGMSIFDSSILILAAAALFFMFGIIEIFNQKLYRKVNEDGYKTDAAKSDFAWARIYAVFWSLGIFFFIHALTVSVLGIETSWVAYFIIGWIISGGSAITRAIKSPECRRNRAKQKERCRGEGLAFRILNWILFWLGELFWPVLFAPVINLVRIFRYISSGAENRTGESERDGDNRESKSTEPRESFTDRIADAIIDMTSNETTGVRPEWKGEVKINEFGEIVCREEGSSDWHKGTRVGSDTMEINGKNYYIKD